MERQRVEHLGRRLKAGLIASLIALSAIAAGNALAQAPDAGGLGPASLRPLPTPTPPGGFDFSIESTRPSPVPRAVEELRFELRGITIVGAKALTDAELQAIYNPYIGKQIGFSDLLNIASAIEAAYRDKGYAIVRAYVPPQRVGNGIFTINVVEGYVNAIAIDGGDAGVRDLVTAYTAPITAARPLEIGSVERGLLLSNDLPGVQASALLRPSPDQPGASDMVVTVNQTPLTGGLNFDNRGSPFTDLWTIGGDVEWNSPTGSADQFYGNVQMAPDPSERIEGTVRYQHPLGTNGLTASVYTTVSNGAPVGVANGISVTTNSIAVGPRLSYPIIRSRNETLNIEGGWTYQDATVNAAGMQFSHDHWNVLDVGATYSQNGFWEGNTTGVIDIAQGLQIFGATENDSPSLSRIGAHTDFTKITFTLKRAQLLWGPISAFVWLQGQWSPVPLVVGEQITFGGYEIGRGYWPSALSGDSGVGGSGELRYDHQFTDSFIQTVQPYIFFDTGKIWNHIGNTPNQAVASTGVGVRLSLPLNITGDVEFASMLLGVPGSNNGERTNRVLVSGAIRF
ncbi:MAG TPA: ShlB/FhaC/HecB family hemolysin secretion/activation protein [Stellaceae bacterium]|nr:ShlB/FhaC/HecB family hemolysin secretion/activation protein [Stellaceae bacterium]